ncbi:MAG: ABC transporter permease, partial [Candidatus Nanopelagicales bacterium]
MNAILRYIMNHKLSFFTSVVVIIGMYWFYFVDAIRAESMLGFAWRYSIPLVLAAMVGIIGERSGVVN